MSDTDIPGTPERQPTDPDAVTEQIRLEPPAPVEPAEPAPVGAADAVPPPADQAIYDAPHDPAAFELPGYEPTRPLGGATTDAPPPPPPTAYDLASAPPPPFAVPYGAPAPPPPASFSSGPVPPADPYQFSVPEPVRPARGAKVPGWLWPVVAVLSLLVGVLGGAIGGVLVANNDDAPSGGNPGGILSVERRTAAPLDVDNQSVPAVAQKVLPSTVKIVAEFKGQAQGASGSGWVLDEEGHVVTNNHVVAEAAEDDGAIDVIDYEGKHHKATVVGRSPVYDLAVLKVEGIEDLPPAAVGSSDQMYVGETVVAVGSPLALTASVTSGIVSAVNRPVTTGDGDEASFINAIQTDAAINPGNSGGPLANLQGQVIGVNSAIATLGSSSEEGGNLGIGFAIPIEQVLVTADQILRTGKAQYPVIGVQVKGSSDVEGAEIVEITSGTPADDSDLRVGDIITAVDERPVTDQKSVIVAIRTHLVTDKVTLTIRRGSETLKIRVGLVAKTG